MMEPDQLDAVFSALAHPVRRAMLLRLMDGPLGVLELAEPFDMSQPAVSKHIRVLEEAGLVSRGRDAQRRPCYLAKQPLTQLLGWVEATFAPARPVFPGLDSLLGRLSSLDARLAASGTDGDYGRPIRR